jgi:hypothetical protein
MTYHYHLPVNAKKWSENHFSFCCVRHCVISTLKLKYVHYVFVFASRRIIGKCLYGKLFRVAKRLLCWKCDLFSIVKTLLSPACCCYVRNAQTKRLIKCVQLYANKKRFFVVFVFVCAEIKNLWVAHFAERKFMSCAQTYVSAPTYKRLCSLLIQITTF